MSSILFVMELAVFVVVAWWAYRRCGRGAEPAETGLLGMKSSAEAGSALASADAPAASPRWNMTMKDRRPGA